MAENKNNTEEGFGIYPNEIAAILYRRRYWLILPILLALAAAGALIMLQKPQYKSSATLLIDTQAIPTTVVASPLTNIANDRIAKIRQQITSRESLVALMNRHKLFREETAAMGRDNVLDLARSAIDVQLVGANQGNGQGGNTIAFTLAFTYKDPVIAKDVTADLTRLFLVEDKRFRTTQASGTADFLGRRAEELRTDLTGLEDKRRGVEARYAGAMPDQVALNAQSIATLRSDLARTDAEIQGLVQQNSLLAARSSEVANAPTPERLALQRSEERLSDLTTRYADDFPEVVALRATVERQRAAVLRQGPPSGSTVIDNEIAASRDRIGILSSRRAQIAQTIADLENRATQAPQASFELNGIERDYDNIKRQYESLRQKQIDAQVAANLQSEDKGERFSVIDEPNVPHESLGKKPKILLLTALAAGIGLGAFLIVAFELLRGTIHGEGSLTRIMGAAPMGIVPVARPALAPDTLYERIARWFATRNAGGVGAR